MKALSTISILTGTLNPRLSVFERMVTSVVTQRYPKRLVEHIVVDGGSDNGTVDLAKRFGCNVLSYPHLRDKEQIRFSQGLRHARGKLILILESDNVLPDPTWISRVVEPFVKEQRVSYSFPAYNTYEDDMSVLTKYCALLGSPDPTLFYLGKSDKIPAGQAQYDKGIVLKETPGYWIVRFDQKTLPTMGDNGFMVRRDILANALQKQREYIHVDAFAHLVADGFDTAGVVKNAIIHLTGKSIIAHVRRRVEVKHLFTDQKREWRNYHVMDWSSTQDRWNLIKFVIFSITFIQPLWVSIWGYWRVRDSAWFLHPLMCFLMVVAYGWSEIKFKMKKIFNKIEL